MNKPDGVKQAVIALWVTLALFSITALVNRWLGDITQGYFYFALLMYGLMCMFPYKINNRSNAARYVYAVLVAITILMMAGGGWKDVPTLDIIVSVVSTPIELFIIYRLFQPEAAAWFSLEK
jgi:hypothetical protein